MSLNWGKIFNLSTETFVEVEFIYFMIPNYLFIPLGLCRYYHIKDMAQTSTKFIQNSYYIKKNLSMLLGITYIINFLLSQIKFSSLQSYPYWRLIACIYLTGFIAWYLSYKILIMELERELSQKWYTHRIFWIANFIVFISRIFIDKRRNFIMLLIHAIRIFAGLILFVYGIKNTNDYQNPRHMSTNSLRESFIDKNKPKEINMNWKVPLINLNKSGLKRYDSNTHNLIISVDKKVKTRYIGSLKCHLYCIILKVNAITFFTEKTLSDFIDLYERLASKPNLLTKTENSFSVFTKYAKKEIKEESTLDYKLIEEIESFLKNLIENQGIIDEDVFCFLEINPNYKEMLHQAAKYNYNNRISMNINGNSNAGGISGGSSGKTSLSSPLIKRNTQLVELQIQSRGNSFKSEKNINLNELANYQIKAKYAYSSINSMNPSLPNYHFDVTLLHIHTKQQQKTWEIIKKLDDFKMLNQNMEKDLKMRLAFYDMSFPNESIGNLLEDDIYNKKVIEGFDRFLTKILDIPAYRCQSLINFLEITEEKLSNEWIQQIRAIYISLLYLDNNVN